MICEEIHKELLRMVDCAATDEGLRISTHVLYPSFEPVRVFISGHGDGFRVHDGGGAVQIAWDHGRDRSLTERVLTKHARLNFLEQAGGHLIASIPSPEWIASAILSVANASSAAAFEAVARDVVAGDTLTDRIERVVSEIFIQRDVIKDYEISGRSGRKYRFDFAVRTHRDRWTLLEGISPHPASIAAKYVAFSDTRDDAADLAGRLAIYEQALDESDAALMQQVATLLPVSHLKGNLTVQPRR